MENKELNIFDLFNALKAHRILMIVSFLILAALSIFYVLQIEKTYKSVLIVNMPLQEGIETEYTIDVLSKHKGNQLNNLFGLRKDSVKITELSLNSIRHEPNSTFAVVEFITTKPDLNGIAKDKFIAYLNNLDFFKKLNEIEREKYQDIINSIKDENGEDIIGDSPVLQFDKKNNPVLVNPIELKEKFYDAKLNLSTSSAVVEVSYLAMPDKFKPSYAMLIVISLVFSFFVSLTLVILKMFYKQTFNN